MFNLEKASRFQTKKRVGCDVFHSNLPFEFTRETKEDEVELLEKAGQSGKWPQQA